MDVTICANYGVLTQEKTTVYSTVPLETAVISEPLRIRIPDSLRPYLTQLGEIALEIDNAHPYLLSETLAAGADGMPRIVWYDKDCKRHTVTPDVYDICDAQEAIE